MPDSALSVLGLKAPQATLVFCLVAGPWLYSSFRFDSVFVFGERDKVSCETNFHPSWYFSHNEFPPIRADLTFLPSQEISLWSSTGH